MTILDDDEKKWTESIISVLEGSASTHEKSFTVKKLRKQVLLSLQLDETEKTAKKAFKKVVQSMEKQGDLLLDAEGIVSLPKKRKRNEDDKKTKKKKKDKEDKVAKDKSEEGESEANQNESNEDISGKNKPCKGNPQGVTRLFLGNLPFAVDEASLDAFLPGKATHIKWITDKETGKFYGSAFIEMENSQVAAAAVAMAGSQLMGRPIKINFAPAREGDVWPPEKKVVSGGGTTGGQAGGTGIKALGEKPENCVKLFIGNLSYDIDDDGIKKFFDNVDAEVKAVRWLHHKESGDFKGCGFVEFWNTEACEKAAALNGKNLLGRPIRIDWTD